MSTENKILTQSEIDSLLKKISQDLVDPEADPGTETLTEELFRRTNVSRVKIYDFKRPDRFTKEHVRLFATLHHNFCRNLTKYFYKKYDKGISFQVASIDQLCFEEYTRSIPNSSIISFGKVQPFKKIVLEVEEKFFTLLKAVDESPSSLPISDRIIHNKDALKMLNAMGNILAEEHGSYFKFKPAWRHWKKHETSFKYINILQPLEICLLITIEFSMQDSEKNEGIINLIYPYTYFTKKNLKQMEKAITHYGNVKIEILDKQEEEGVRSMKRKESNKKMSDYRRNYEALKNTKVELEAKIGKRWIEVEQALTLKEGSIVTLDKLAGEAIDVYVNGIRYAKGEVAIVDENFAVRITDLVT